MTKQQTQLQRLPDELLDSGGYPTKEWLAFLKSYQPDESLPIEYFIENVLADGWWAASWGFTFHRKYKGIRKLELHTGGWSGNEEIIDIIKSNMWLTHFSMRYIKWTVGGHYYFRVTV